MGPHEYLDCKLALAAKYRFSTTSGLRSVDRNFKEKCHKNSRHLLFLADDCVLDWPKQYLRSFVADARRMGLRAIIESDHVHLQTK